MPKVRIHLNDHHPLFERQQGGFDDIILEFRHILVELIDIDF
jgi:hypothetical protein